ncbi:hypothetical protein BDN72DRAFT_668762 [Pluteus cervinus]|uniref:Uncharacterized protein n=1 Tax=Pluteus cervinus TaxID=181527 RepID=A0ACD3B9U6_9AGAR|nr:hypothetical protein BDN72DRAFT_668762 [Pluteus cervinus]
MPAARTTARSRSHLGGSPPRQLTNQATIIIDENQPAPLRSGNSTRRTSTSTSRKQAVVQLGDVIEISSDEDEEPVNSSQRAMGELRKKVRKLEDEVTRTKREKVRAEDDLKQLREEHQTLKNGFEKQGREKASMDVSQLQENILCEVCTMPMWSPHLLPGCGHTFCQSCLADWFNTTHRQFVAARPEVNLNDDTFQTLGPIFQIIQSGHHHMLAHPRYQQLIQAQENDKPKYTCPTCRETVRARPVENFAMKAVVRTVMAASSEKSPAKNLRHKTDPWARFFPRRA